MLLYNIQELHRLTSTSRNRLFYPGLDLGERNGFERVTIVFFRNRIVKS